MPETAQSIFQRRGGRGGKGGRKWGGRWGGKDNSNSTDNSSTPTPTSVPATADDPYFDWNEADKKKMILVTKVNGAVYVGQNRTFSCRVSHFYYAQGLIWAIKYKNQSIEYINGREGRSDFSHHWGGGIHHFEILLGKNQQFLDMTITSDLQAITCHAPVWNSTEWGEKSLNFVVKQPTAPKLVGKAHKEYSWYLNDTRKTLVCEFSGEPMPKVLWKKGNASFALNTNTTNGSSTVYFPRVTLESDATYECIISNEAGTISKTFRVTVLHSISSSISAILILSLVGFIIVSIVAGFMFKYLKSQNNVINHLANLAFKDVTSTNGGGDSSNPTTNSTATIRSAISVDTNGVILPSISSPSSPQPIPTISTSSVAHPDHLPKPNGGGRTNNGFVFDYTVPIQADASSDQQRPPSPQPPLSSFSSYHKF